MDDRIRRTFKRWSIAELIYGLGIILTAYTLIPWKTPPINILLIAYGIGHLAAGHGLFRSRGWGYRLSVLLGTTGVILGILLCTGLITSAAYLWGIYGDFGYGAAIIATLFASVVLQLFMLYPILKLCSLLRRPIRHAMGTSNRWWKALLGLSMLPLLGALLVGSLYRMPTVNPVPKEERGLATQFLRAALLGDKKPNIAPLLRIPLGAGPLYATVWHQGRILARVSGDGENLGEAVRAAGNALRSHPKVLGSRIRHGRVKVDRVTGTVPIPLSTPWFVALSVNPGLDGLRRARGGASKTLLPDDLIKSESFGTAPLVPGIRELRLGLDTKKILPRLALSGAGLERIRTESWLESAPGDPLPVQRGNTPGPSPGPEAWRQAAIAGGDFILRQIRKDGRFHYQYFPLRGVHPRTKRGQYSLPRHAGTIYALSLLYGHTGLPRFRKGAERAMKWLTKRVRRRCGTPVSSCVAPGRYADLGSSALGAVAMLEYQRQTGDTRYQKQIKAILAFISFLQRDDGEFAHLFNRKNKKVNKTYRSMFFSEEAALALVLGHKVLGSTEYLSAAEAALDYLTADKYGFFLGWFVYGADHWTCIAADEAWPALTHGRYLDFCVGYARFIGGLQYEAGKWDNVDYIGHYGLGGFMVPQAPGAAGFTEATISTLNLARRHGRHTPDIRNQIALAANALTRDQIRSDNSWLMPEPKEALGGIRRSLVESEVRIDFTQHAASALIRAAQIENRRKIRF